MMNTEEEADRCPICLYDITQKSTTDVCLHVFCHECLFQWAAEKLVCPICRARFKKIRFNYRDGDKYEERSLRSPNLMDLDEPDEVIGNHQVIDELANNHAILSYLQSRGFGTAPRPDGRVGLNGLNINDLMGPNYPGRQIERPNPNAHDFPALNVSIDVVLRRLAERSMFFRNRTERSAANNPMEDDPATDILLRNNDSLRVQVFGSQAPRYDNSFESLRRIDDDLSESHLTEQQNNNLFGSSEETVTARNSDLSSSLAGRDNDLFRTITERVDLFASVTTRRLNEDDNSLLTPISGRTNDSVGSQAVGLFGSQAERDDLFRALDDEGGNYALRSLRRRNRNSFGSQTQRNNISFRSGTGRDDFLRSLFSRNDDVLGSPATGSVMPTEINNIPLSGTQDLENRDADERLLQFYRQNEDQVLMLVPWLRTHLNWTSVVFVFPMETVQDIILRMVREIPIRSEEFREALEPYFPNYSNCFVKAFYDAATKQMNMRNASPLAICQ